MFRNFSSYRRESDPVKSRFGIVQSCIFMLGLPNCRGLRVVEIENDG